MDCSFKSSTSSTRSQFPNPVSIFSHYDYSVIIYNKHKIYHLRPIGAMVARVTPNDEVERSSRLWVGDFLLLAVQTTRINILLLEELREVVVLCFEGVTWSLAFWRARWSVMARRQDAAGGVPSFPRARD